MVVLFFSSFQFQSKKHYVQIQFHHPTAFDSPICYTIFTKQLPPSSYSETDCTWSRMDSTQRRWVGRRYDAYFHD